MAPTPSVVESHAGRVRINLLWLIKLRWAAVIGQLFTIGTVDGLMGVHLPMMPVLAGIILATALSNLALTVWFRRHVRQGTWESWGDQGESLERSVVVTDILLLTALLFVTGGPGNPFAIFYLVHVVLAAVLLRPRSAWALTVLAVACYGSLFLAHVPLPALDSSELHLEGLFVAFTAAAAISVYFVVRVTHELAKREDDLREARQRRERSERVESLVTLAAGAAHELATPLSTIAVVARELERELDRGRDWPPEVVEDARLIRREVARCRGILDQMAGRAGDAVGEEMQWTTLGELLQQIIDPLHADERVRLQCAGGVAERSLFVPGRALKRALRGLVKNGLDASGPGEPVVVTVTAGEDDVLFEVRDEGRGMTETELARAWDPFFTTKEPGSGMGLGLYLARMVVERLGGALELTSVAGEGTTVTARLPLASRLEGAPAPPELMEKSS